MPVIVLQFDNFKSNVYTRPDSCPYCGSPALQSWGTGEKPVQDASLEVGEYHRYRCSTCGRTFRHYVQGVDKTRLTQRIRKIAGISWAMGLSARDVVAVLADCGIELSYMTVWRDGNYIVTRFKDSFGPDQPGRYSRYSIDKLSPKNRVCGEGTSIMVDLGCGKTIVLGRIDAVDYRPVLGWLEHILKELDIQVSVMGTDVLINMGLSRS